MKFKGRAQQRATEEALIIAGEGRIMQIINKMEVRRWMKFQQALDRGHGEKLASGVVAVLVLSHLHGAQEQHRSGLPVAHQAQGHT